MFKSVKMVVISFLVTLILMFGGFWGYQQVMIKKPIVSFLEDQQELRLQYIHVNPSRVEVGLTVSDSGCDGFIQKYPELVNRLKGKAKGKQLQVHLTDRPNKRLQTAWDQMAFGIREGIANQTYSQIPEAAKKWAEKYGVRYFLKMDEESVYIILCDGDHFLIRTVPVKTQKQKGGGVFG
ncbi:MAG: hypothetical protein WB502_07140 [Thermoactinomyces sp.]